jgi:hypothetical protein
MAEQSPEVHHFDAVEPAANPRAEVAEGPAQRVGIVAERPTFRGPRASLLDRDDVAQGAAAQRIADQMPAGTHLHLCHRPCVGASGDRGAPGDLSGEGGRAGTGQGRADQRVQPVGADQHLRLRHLAAGRHQQRPRAGQVDPFDPLPQPDLDAGRARAGGQKVDQVGPMDKAEAAPGQVEPQNARPAPPVAQFDRLGAEARRLQRRAEAERRQHRAAGPGGGGESDERSDARAASQQVDLLRRNSTFTCKRARRGTKSSQRCRNNLRFPDDCPNAHVMGVGQNLLDRRMKCT